MNAGIESKPFARSSALGAARSRDLFAQARVRIRTVWKSGQETQVFNSPGALVDEEVGAPSQFRLRLLAGDGGVILGDVVDSRAVRVRLCGARRIGKWFASPTR